MEAINRSGVHNSNKCAIWIRSGRKGSINGLWLLAKAKGAVCQRRPCIVGFKSGRRDESRLTDRRTHTRRFSKVCGAVPSLLVGVEKCHRTQTTTGCAHSGRELCCSTVSWHARPTYRKRSTSNQLACDSSPAPDCCFVFGRRPVYRSSGSEFNLDKQNGQNPRGTSNRSAKTYPLISWGQVGCSSSIGCPNGALISPRQCYSNR